MGLVNPNSLLAVDLAARREAEEEEPLDLTGFCVCELCGWGRLTYASTRTLDGLSMYFSIKRSLFHDICRKSRLAVLPWKDVVRTSAEGAKQEKETYFDSKDVADILHVLPHLFLNLRLAQGAIVSLVGLAHRLWGDFKVVAICVHVHLVIRDCKSAVNVVVCGAIKGGIAYRRRRPGSHRTFHRRSIPRRNIHSLKTWRNLRVSVCRCGNARCSSW